MLNFDYSVIFNATSNGMAFTDFESNVILDVNMAWVEQTGFSRAHSIGKTALELGLWPNAADRSRCLAQVKAQGSSKGFYTQLNIRGVMTPHLIYGRAVRNPHQHYVLWEFCDITEREASAQQLRKLSLAVEQSADSIIICGLDGRIEYVNHACVEETGYRAEELIGQNPRVLQSGETPRATYAALWAALKAGETWRGEFISQRKNGERYIERAVITPLRDHSADGADNGQISHYVAIKRDITDEKCQESELSTYRQHLETLVSERTAELALARQKAESASQAKSNFLANMSHEIRTPMNAMVGLTHMLQRGELLPGQGDKLNKIALTADHLLHIINDILDLSKIEAEKLVLEKNNFEIATVLDRVSSMVIDRVREKGLELIVDADPLLGVVSGDSTRLTQALLNYLSNAAKFTERGTIILRTRLLEQTDTEKLVHFEVSDTGIGIPADALNRVFQPFEQADSSTTRRFGGTGLGLAITQRMAHLMGGDVGVNSQVGVGSTFWLTARFGRVSHSAERYLIPALLGCRALVVDDSPMTRVVQSQLLRAAGMVTEITDSGAEALAMIRRADSERTPFDLLLIDLLMPQMNGIELFAALRALPLSRQPSAWLVTASGDASVTAEASAAGFSELLLKPLTAVMLDAALKRQLPALLDHGSDRLAPPHAPRLAHIVNTVSSPTTLNDMPESALKRDFHTARLLIVDDERFNREVALMILDEIGWQVDQASNGQEAVDMVRANDYHLILMDMRMPTLDGVAATRLIRTLPGRQTLPILAMTGSASNEDRTLCLQAGMSDFITKPISPQHLFQVMLQSLRASWPHGLNTP